MGVSPMEDYCDIFRVCEDISWRFYIFEFCQIVSKDAEVMRFYLRETFPHFFQGLLWRTCRLDLKKVGKCKNGTDWGQNTLTFLCVCPSLFLTASLVLTASPLSRVNLKELLMALDGGGCS